MSCFSTASFLRILDHETSAREKQKKKKNGPKSSPAQLTRSQINLDWRI